MTDYFEQALNKLKNDLEENIQMVDHYSHNIKRYELEIIDLKNAINELEEFKKIKEAKP